MMWWFVAAIVIAVCWKLRRPIVRRDVQRSDFSHFFEALLVGSRTGAWIEIIEAETGNRLYARKEDALGHRVTIEVDQVTSEGADELIRALGELFAEQKVETTRRSETNGHLSFVIGLGEAKPVQQVTAIAISVFDLLGSPAGRRFRLRGKGKPDPEHWRPILRSFQRDRHGSRLRRIGEAGIKLLDRRKKEK